MPDTNHPPKNTQKSHQPHAGDEQLDEATAYSKTHFPIDFAALADDVSQGITTCLELIDTNDLSDKENSALTLKNCEVLEKFALASARLLGEYAVQEIEWITEHSRSEGQTRKAALKQAWEARSQ